MYEQLERGRYPRENGKVIIEVAIRNTWQLFNERDPAPSRARDLDENFVTYVVSSAQEFPLKTPLKLKITVLEKSPQDINKEDLHAAIRAHFIYAARLSKTKMRKSLRVGRYFLMIGLLVLFVCLGIAQLISSKHSDSGLAVIAHEGFTIIGWVAMWRPIEVFLYDWFPLREEKLYLEKIATLEIDLILNRTP